MCRTDGRILRGEHVDGGSVVVVSPSVVLVRVFYAESRFWLAEFRCSVPGLETGADGRSGRLLVRRTVPVGHGGSADPQSG